MPSNQTHPDILSRTYHDVEVTAQGHHDDHGPAKGVMRWLTTTNHKDIGTMYLIFSLVMFLTGGSMALVVRAELFMPGMNSSARTTSAIVPPMKNMMQLKIRYIVPMSL